MYNSIVDTFRKNHGRQRQFGAQLQTAKPFRALCGMAIDPNPAGSDMFITKTLCK
jgi:hypothetical protein